MKSLLYFNLSNILIMINFWTSPVDKINQISFNILIFYILIHPSVVSFALPKRDTFFCMNIHLIMSQLLSLLDLDILLSSDLSFDRHIQLFSNYTYKKLSFIFRSSKYFKNKLYKLKYIIILLACVRSQLKYALIVWISCII